MSLGQYKNLGWEFSPEQRDKPYLGYKKESDLALMWEEVEDNE
jgi:hypothetical protein